MAEELDAGPIIHQKQIKVYPDDTANSLYQRVLALEEEVFREAFDDLVSLNPPRKEQSTGGSIYKKSDLDQVREIRLDDQMAASDLVDKIRALTTNNPKEAAYFRVGNRKIGVRIEFFDI